MFYGALERVTIALWSVHGLPFPDFSQGNTGFRHHCPEQERPGNLPHTALLTPH